LNHFYGINDIVINRKKISKFLSNDDRPQQEQEAFDFNIKATGDNTNDNYDSANTSGDNDRPYTRAEIAKLLEYSDLRTKVVILIMASAGLRLNALPLLRMNDLIEIQKYNIYQIRVYSNSRKDRYHTFCTPEAKKAIDNYLDYRRQAGEHITPKSPLLRHEFDRTDIFQVANNVKPLSKFSIKKTIHQILYISGLRTPLVAGQNKNKVLNVRRRTAMNHGFRKFFETWCIHSGMNPTYVKLCTGHSLGVEDSYILPQPDGNGIYQEILEGSDKSLGFIAAIDYLTIDDTQRLKRENETLKVKKSEIEQLKEQAEAYKSFMATFNPKLEEFQREINNLKIHLNSQNNSRKKADNDNNIQQPQSIVSTYQ